MKYSTMVIAATLAVPGMALAAGDRAPAGDRYVDNMVECISDFIASEQDDSTREQYIAACMQAKAAAQQPANATGKKG
jgi:hypothetical protein